jgi:phosphoribosylamine--glycine ligase
MKWAADGLVVPTGNNKHMRELDAWRRMGSPVFGPSLASAALEVNRGRGMEALEAAGIEVPAYRTFKTLREAEHHVRKTEQSFVFKTLGDEEDKSLSFVCSNPAEMVAKLQKWQADGMRLKGPCMLQEKIDMVAELGIAGWMGPDGFLPERWELAFEHKRLMPGGWGPNTGEQGTVCQYVKDSRLADEVLIPLEGLLRQLKHTGDANINCGIDAKGRAWPFEWTARLGWPDFYIRQAMHEGADPAQWMRDLLRGRDSLKVNYDVAIGVVMAQKPYPYDDGTPEEVEGNPVYGAEDLGEQLHPVQMMIGRGAIMDGDAILEGSLAMTTGPYVAVVTGTGATVAAAQASVYGALDKLSTQWIIRDDIGRDLEDTLPKLHKLGLAEEMRFA